MATTKFFIVAKKKFYNCEKIVFIVAKKIFIFARNFF